MIVSLIPMFAISTISSAHEPDGKCHRPDDNECRHPCHHRFCECSNECEPKCRVGGNPCLNRCIMDCFREHAECVNQCPED